MVEAVLDRRTAPMPEYGLDAPGVVRGLLGAAVALGLIGVLMRILAGGWVALLAWPVLLAAAVPLLLGVSMRLYSSLGKHRLRDHLLRQRTWRGDETVLDIGAGRGLMAIGAAHRVPAGRVIALDLWSARDLSGNTPDALRANAALEGVSRTIEVVTGDAQRLELPDASIDAVVSLFCLHNIEPPGGRAQALREIARVLRPGGTVMIGEFPSAAPYVAPLRDAGLAVVQCGRAERIALGIAGTLVARKEPA